MSDLDAVLEGIRDWSDQGLDFALATVVGVRGSTYRGLAARQLVGIDGAGIGTVSGGCLDRDLHAVALEVINSGNPRRVEFDLTADDEAIWGWGIGCNGATEVLVEPAAMARELAGRIGRIRSEQRPTAIVHALDPAHLARRGYVTSTSTEGDLTAQEADEAREALAHGFHRLAETAAGRRLVEVVAAPSRLVVCGAGHDAAPVVRFGAMLGFHVVVVDDRRQFLDRERFPEATGLVHCEASELARHVEIDPRTYVVVMSHNYLRDLDYLRSLAPTAVGYVGVLGPGARIERLFGDLEGEGVKLAPGFVSRVHAPAGLDLGAEGPDEIAWAILAEVLAVRRDRTGGRLRSRKGPDRLRRLA
ncbi:MAG: XdhC family protein [Acidimicrobiia bacterium]|jgi:xanthine dehydrogenase accessory factor